MVAQIHVCWGYGSGLRDKACQCVSTCERFGPDPWWLPPYGVDLDAWFRAVHEVAALAQEELPREARAPTRRASTPERIARVSSWLALGGSPSRSIRGRT